MELRDHVATLDPLPAGRSAGASPTILPRAWHGAASRSPCPPHPHVTPRPAAHPLPEPPALLVAGPWLSGSTQGSAPGQAPPSMASLWPQHRAGWWAFPGSAHGIPWLQGLGRPAFVVGRSFPDGFVKSDLRGEATWCFGARVEEPVCGGGARSWPVTCLVPAPGWFRAGVSFPGQIPEFLRLLVRPVLGRQ